MNLNVELTQTEYQVGEMLVRGDQTKEVAYKLFKSPHTINEHRKHLFRKAGVTSIGQFCYWWFHKHYDIKPKALLTAVTFFFLALFNEVAIDDQDMVRASRTRTSKGGKRKNEK